MLALKPFNAQLLYNLFCFIKKYCIGYSQSVVMLISPANVCIFCYQMVQKLFVFKLESLSEGTLYLLHQTL